MILLKNRYSKHYIENIKLNIMTYLVIAKKLNFGKIAKFKKLKNTKYYFCFLTITIDIK